MFLFPFFFSIREIQLADDAGALLVRSGLIRDEDLVQARQCRIEEGGTLGEQLVLGGFIADDELTQFFRTRLMVPQVNPNHLARLPSKIIAKVPPDMASEFRVIPVSVDRDGNLMVAMSDPSDSHAVDEIAFFTGHYVVRSVATQMQIAWCLAHYYGCVSPLGAKLLKPREGDSQPTPLPRSSSVTGQVTAERRRVMPPRSSDDPADNQAREDSGPVLEILADSPSGAYRIGDETSPTAPINLRDSSSPPELVERHGELLVRSHGPRPSSDLPAVIVDVTGAIVAHDAAAPGPKYPTNEEDDETPTVAHAVAGTESSPILLTRPKAPSKFPLRPASETDPNHRLTPAEAPTDRHGAAPERDAAAEPTEASEVIVLATPKGQGKRRSRSTQVGLGFEPFPKVPRGSAAAASRRAKAGPVPPEPYDEDEDGEPPTIVDDAPGEGIPTEVLPEESEGATGQFVSLSAPPQRGDVDDGWGPPGSTIPPPFLGALPGTGPDDLTGQIPLSVGDVDTQEHRTAELLYDDHDSGPQLLEPKASGLATAAAVLIDTLRAIDRAQSRDGLIDVLIAYLAGGRERVAFLAVKAGSVTVWKATPEPTNVPAPLLLDAASTVRDLVATRLPFRGPLVDERSRAFLVPLLGDGDALLVPISVRERVVGVLAGGIRIGKLYDEHLAVLARAAGTALERILKSRRAG